MSRGVGSGEEPYVGADELIEIYSIAQMISKLLDCFETVRLPLPTICSRPQCVFPDHTKRGSKGSGCLVDYTR